MTTDTRTQHTHWGIGAEMLTPAGTVEIHSDEGDVIGFVFPQYAEKVAAAPDLLAALELAATRITRSERYGCMCGETGVQTPCGHCVWTRARAAIAKAKGQ